MKNPFSRALSALRRAAFGVSPEEIRFTFEDVRSEIRATKAELKGEIAVLRHEIERLHEGEDRVRGAEIPVAEA